MRVILSILIPITILAYELRVGREVFFPDGVDLGFSDVRTILIVLSDYLGLPTPRASGDSLVFNGKVLKISEEIDIEDLLSFFEIPFIESDSSIIVPECVIESVEFKDRSLKVTYHGNPAFVYLKEDSVLKIKAEGYVYMDGEIFEPGEVLFKRNVSNLKMGSLVESIDSDVLKFEKYEKVRRLILEDFGEWGGEPIGEESILIEFGKGDGRVVIRPFSRDLAGFDRSVFEENRDLAREIAKRLGYSLEICPLMDLPVGGKALLVLMKSGDSIERIVKIIEEMIDFEVLDDRLDSAFDGAGS